MQSWRVAVFVGLFVFGAGQIAEAATAAQTGKASYYRHGKRTANGERFDPHGFTAAHRTLPFGTRVLVTNLKNGMSVIVRINDRGPHVKGRIIDLSLGAAKVVGLTAHGITQVKIVPLEQAGVAAAPPAVSGTSEAAKGVVLVPPAKATAGLQ